MNGRPTVTLPTWLIFVIFGAGIWLGRKLILEEVLVEDWQEE